MTASGAAEKLGTIEGVIELARVYLGVVLDRRIAERYVKPFVPNVQLVAPTSIGWSWSSSPTGVTAGPIIYLKNRLIADGFYDQPQPSEAEDFLPLIKISGESKSGYVVDIAPVARSKMFTTQKLVFPIDLTAARVSIMESL